jgi:hypothetical protein
MKFRTEVEINPPSIKIEHTNSILAIGSCFAENIGNFFSRYKFTSLINPFGVLYNAASILNSIKLSIDNNSFVKDDLIYDQEEWHSFYHHSDFSHHNYQEVLNKINQVTESVNSFIKNVDWILVSLGTSFVYKHHEKNIIVSNCHKLPSKNFEKSFLAVDENENYIHSLISLIRNQNPNSKFIFTVSPIRHWKDGPHENQLSKSSLHLAVNNIIAKHENVFYFPSYEIVMDELRDYRFYTKDLLHPSEEAIEYIWELFSNKYFSDECAKTMKELERILSAAKHRIRNVNSTSTKNFAKKNINLISELSATYDHINFDEELKIFNSYLNKQ